MTARDRLGFVAPLAVTSMSLSSGFIWAYQQRAALVFAAAFTAWTSYLAAHYLATGLVIDDRDDGGFGWRDVAGEPSPVAGVVVGVAVLVAGMVVGTIYIRAENHLLTNVGGVLFLGGYVLAHQAATDKPL